PVKQQMPPSAPGPKKTPPGGGSGGPSLSGLLAGAVGELKGDDHEAEAALFGAQKGPLDTSVLASRRERGHNEAQAIGPIVTNGSQQVGIGDHVDAPARGKVEDITIDDPPEMPDIEKFMRFINARRTALAACYERELKYDRGLRGKVTVHLTVAPDG